jgi:haloacid dehalogenase-like hydrolase
MARRLVPFAIAYDFDGTLAPGNMQEHLFIPKIKMKKREFWREVKRLAKEHEADDILIYMGLMLERAAAEHVPARKADIRALGRGLKLFSGVEDWFRRINTYGKQSGVSVEHYVISSGIREMVAGTSIGRKFRAIFASSFWYDHNEVATRPALALNYTTKTQYLFRINKGSLSVHDHDTINAYVAPDERAVPFENIVYIGDGETDVPCFRLVKDQNGHSIAVYKPGGHGARQVALKIMEDGRVNFIAPADYNDGKRLDRIVKAIIDKVAIDNELRLLENSV